MNGKGTGKKRNYWKMNQLFLEKYIQFRRNDAITFAALQWHSRLKHKQEMMFLRPK